MWNVMAQNVVLIKLIKSFILDYDDSNQNKKFSICRYDDAYINIYITSIMCKYIFYYIKYATVVKSKIKSYVNKIMIVKLMIS